MLFKKATGLTNVEYVGDKKKTGPMIYFTTDCLMKMKSYIQLHPQEISWLGVVENKDNVYLVKDVMLFEQTVTAVTTQISEESLTTFGSHLIESGQMDLFNKIKLWGHSHVNMGTSPSGTDESTFEQFYENSDFFIRLIGNKSGDMRVDFVDNVNGFKYTNIEWYELKSDEELQLDLMIQEFGQMMEAKQTAYDDLAKAEIANNIKSPVVKEYPFQGRGSGFGSGWARGNGYYEDDSYDSIYLKGDGTVIGFQETPTVKKKGSRIVKISNGETRGNKLSKWLDIGDAYEDKELLDLCDVIHNWTMLKELLRDDDRTEHYNAVGDWEDLYVAICQWLDDYNDELEKIMDEEEAIQLGERLGML